MYRFFRPDNCEYTAAQRNVLNEVATKLYHRAMRQRPEGRSTTAEDRADARKSVCDLVSNCWSEGDTVESLTTAVAHNRSIA